MWWTKLWTVTTHLTVYQLRGLIWRSNCLFCYKFLQHVSLYISNSINIETLSVHTTVKKIKWKFIACILEISSLGSKRYRDLDLDRLVDISAKRNNGCPGDGLILNNLLLCKIVTPRCSLTSTLCHISHVYQIDNDVLCILQAVVLLSSYVGKASDLNRMRSLHADHVM